MHLLVLCPHFAPDTAPTGTIITRIVAELVERGHRVDVVTALPWYRNHAVEPGWQGKLVRTERAEWGTITRVNPFPSGKRHFVKRALAFGAFSALVGWKAALGPKVDGVLAMSPPLTMGLTGWGVALARRAPLVFNIQDVFPDVAIDLGVLRNRRVIALAKWLEKVSYRRARAVTVLSDDLRENLAAKVGPAQAAKVEVIPNFVDTVAITPGEKHNSVRRELGVKEGSKLVMYAGNIGLSQPLDLMLDAARVRKEVHFAIVGGGAQLASLQAGAVGLDNVSFLPFQPAERLSEVLAAADIHLVLLKKGLGKASVPSKMYSILAAGRPILAGVDDGTEVARVVEEIGAGRAVAPEDAFAVAEALKEMLEDEEGLVSAGAAGRAWVEHWASPAAVAEAYEELFRRLAR